MKIDNTSLFFNGPLAPGEKGGTAAWGTSAGQSKTNGYKIDTSKKGIIDLFIGMNYNIKTDVEKLDISEGSSSRELLFFSVFEKVFINNLYVDDVSFILLLVKEHSKNHDGRIIISYPPYAAYEIDGQTLKNSEAIKKMAFKIGCPDGCWFVHEISVNNQDELHFKGIVVSSTSKEYVSSQARKQEWDRLVDQNNFNEIQQIPLKISSIIGVLSLTGLVYESIFLNRFVASLAVKPFVILTGLSGSGKTKLAQAFVTWISASPSQFCIVPVGADWTNREPLLGYPNGLDLENNKYVAPDSGSLQLLIRASENSTLPHFLILDEMNLSHVERYFADFLSVMESQDKIRLYSGKNRFITEEGKDDVPQEIGWPKNLFIIGTVNIDETTYMFSPKVLDRANVIEFRISADEMDKFLQEPIKPDLSNLLEEKENPDKGGLGKGMAADFMDLAIEKKIPAPTDEKLVTTLNGFFTELQKAGAEFGYRSASEILLLMKNLEKIRVKNESVDDPEKIRDEHLDIAIMQKLLPKLHGSRNKLIKVLETLAGLCLAKGEDSKTVKSEFLNPFSKNEKTEADFEGDKIRFKISFLKLCRMYKAAMENGYASYAEA